MAMYKAYSTNAKNFTLLENEEKIGELLYNKWYSFNAEIVMADGMKLQLEPTGFWNSQIELKENGKVIAQFEMGWHGIIVKTMFGNDEQLYLLKLKGLLSNKFILLDADKNELLVAESEFKWNQMNFNYNIETGPEFDNGSNKEILLFTILHGINYYMAVSISAI